ncbi:phosphatidylinositol N-acetylglucosaminyltransferase subunit GPI1 [Coprinopsis marcescibilis]|uniref:Phosphatidylinositol N-acetylglucosaminyltransferase subunit GPI1 n=1 Tax=Coprinopsis marcescibilis TaxID=230819 RepID=A0A5C3LBY2_COPMA|nr:phosphatidylinositol N-acetylglucosaminyltransferase subunit GPI1 [Coprinopsis marcescibilis]
MLSTLTVFWPLEETDDGGIPYGWLYPGKVCVAGVLLDGLTVDEAEERLNRFTWLPESKPSVLHDLDLTAYSRIYYHRYPSQSLRFYDLDDSRHEHTEGLDYNIVQHFNQAYQVHSIVNGLPIRLHKPTAAFLLNIAATLIRPVVSLSRYVYLPFLPRLLPHFAFAQQLRVRGSQAETFLTNIEELAAARDVTPIPQYAQRYTSFFNDIWLLLNDYTIGFGFGTLLCENHRRFADSLVVFIQTNLLLRVEDTLVWLDSWPAGLKLNTELSKFYSRMFISIVQLWGDLLLRYMLPHAPMLVLFCGYTSVFGGFTLAIAAIIDIIGFCVTPHLTVCYMLSRLVYSIVKGALVSLWALFRGKRYNVLRKRMDTWDCDVDQLLLGTLLFTLLAFLFPTILAYYFLFASIHICLLWQQAVIETLLAFMNNFPLFKLMLKFKDPSRLPATIYFRPSQNSIVIQVRSYSRC